MTKANAETLSGMQSLVSVLIFIPTVPLAERGISVQGWLHLTR